MAYRDLFTGAIDSASLDGYVLTVTFTVTEDAASTVDLDPADVIPTFLVGLYGWDTKDFIVSPPRARRGSQPLPRARARR